MTYILIIEDEKFLLYQDVIIYKKYKFFNLICFRKEFDIDEVKGLVIDVELLKKAWIYEFFMFHIIPRPQEIRIIMNNGEVIKIRTRLYGEYLKILSERFEELKNDNNRIKQPIHRE